MRANWTVVISGLMLAGAAAGTPRVLAPISDADVHQICKAVATVAKESVRGIGSMTSTDYVVGVKPEQSLIVHENGEREYITVYPRRDRVRVTTGCDHCGTGVIGREFELQKGSDGWKITRQTKLVD